ncbi:MAG: hypothetical protein K8F91_26600, partial [Candidatus Obscuribacterales bacterium]|nr:hypothetical protein [Candidatus Obscuribacterales bacterium]
LPTLAMYRQIDWILSQDDFHPSVCGLACSHRTTSNLQSAYDTLVESWMPDEVVIVDGQDSGFDTRGVKTFIIDHHVGNGEVDNDVAFIKQAPSAGCLLIDYFGVREPILAVSILTDTFWFRQNMPADAVKHMAVLTEHGLTDELLADYQKRLMVRKSTTILTAMKQSDMRFSANGDAAFLVLTGDNPEDHRGVMAELGYFCRHMCAVRGDGYVSFRTVDERIDLRPLAEKYGRGGHAQQAAGQVDVTDKGQLETLYADFLSVIEPFGAPWTVAR